MPADEALIVNPFPASEEIVPAQRHGTSLDLVGEACAVLHYRRRYTAMVTFCEASLTRSRYPEGRSHVVVLVLKMTVPSGQ